MAANARSIALQVAILDADRAIQALRGLGDAGESGFQKIAANGNAAVRAVEQVGTGIDRLGARARTGGDAFSGFGSKVQQLSYQVNDFAVQVQSGQSWVTALVQQGSQVLGAFGPIGGVLAVVGAGAAALYTHFGNVASSAKETTDILKDVLAPGFRDASVEVDGYAKALAGATAQQKQFAAAVAGLNVTSLKQQGVDTTQQFVDSGVAEFRKRVNPKIPIEAPNLDLNQQLATGETFGVRRDREIARLSDDLTSRLKAALDAGDPDEVLKIVNESGLTGDAEGAELAKKLVETATKIKAQKQLQAKTSQSGISPDIAQAQFRAQQLPPDYDRQRPFAPVPVSKSDTAIEADVVRQEQAATALAAKRKAAGDAAERQAQSSRNLITAAKLEADTTERLAEATKYGTDARQLEQIETEKQRKILEASKTLKGQDLEYYKQLAERVAVAQQAELALNQARARGVNQTQPALRNQAERESLVSLDKYKQEQVRKEVADREQAAKAASDRQAEILIQPWKDLASAATETTTKIFDDMLAKGKVSGGELADSLNTSLRTSISGLAGNLVTQPLNQAIAKIGSGEYSSPLDFAKQNPGLATVGGSYVAGTVLDQVRGKETYAALGGAVGAGAGAIIGSFVPGVGTIIGGAVGGALGTGIGSLFSSGGGLGNDNSAQSYVTRSGKIEYSDKSFSAGNRQITSGVLGQVASLQESLAGLGASFKNAAFLVEAGNKSGYKLNGVQYGSEQELLQATLKELAKGTTGLTASQQTVLKNTKGRSAQEVLSDVEFAKEYDRLTSKGGDVAAAIGGLNEQFTVASRRAKQLGLDTTALGEAQKKALADLKVEQIGAASDLQRQISAQIAGVGASFDGLIQPLRAVANDNGATSPLAQIEQARSRFRETLDQARSGDLQGTQQLAGAAQALQQLSSRYLGGGGLGAEIAREIASGTSGIASTLEQQKTETLASLPQVQRETVASAIKAQVEQTDRMVEQLEKLRQELRQAYGYA